MFLLIKKVNMKKTLYIFRHGQSEWNKLKKIQGSVDSPLTSLGVQQAKRIPAHLKDKNIGIIYSSHLKRAWKTGEVVAKELGIEIIENKDLREICGGAIEGKTIKEASEKFKEKYDVEWMSSDPEYDDMKFPNGESKRESRQRMVNTISKLSMESIHNIIGFASHSFTIRQLIIACGNENFRYLNNCEIVHLEFDTDKYNIETPHKAFSFIGRIRTDEDFNL